MTFHSKVDTWFIGAALVTVAPPPRSRCVSRSRKERVRAADRLVIVDLPDPQQTRALYQSLVSRRGRPYTEEAAR